MKYVIHLQQDHLDRMLQAARREIATPRQMLENIGETLLNANRERHAQGLAPDGSKWKELAPLTLAAKQGKGSMLVGHYPNRSGARRGGDMLSSLNYQVDGNTLTLGFDDAKAWWHHAGTDPYTIVPREKKALAFAGIARKRVRHPGLPSRKLLGFHDADKNRVGRLIDEHLNLIIRNANAD